jgi:hypothetical protein
MCTEPTVSSRPSLLAFEDGGLGCHVLIMLHDTLHCLDLGPSQQVAGTVLWLLTYGDYVLDGQPHKALDTVVDVIQELYVKDKTPTRFTNIRLEMFADEKNPTADPPELKGKGAETRHLIPILEQLWRRFARAGDAHDAHVLALLESLSEIYAILDFKTADNATPHFLNDAMVLELRTCIDRFLTHFSFLRSLADEHDLKTWWMTSKTHSVWHVGFEAQFQHPSMARTYINEDFVRLLQQCGLSNRHAIPAAQRSIAVTRKYAMGKSLELLFRCD